MKYCLIFFSLEEISNATEGKKGKRKQNKKNFFVPGQIAYILSLVDH